MVAPIDPKDKIDVKNVTLHYSDGTESLRNISVKFKYNSINVLFGPAPYQLNWLKVSLAMDGQIMVDTSRKVDRKDFLRI